jgi:hypothetical protein
MLLLLNCMSALRKLQPSPTPHNGPWSSQRCSGGVRQVVANYVYGVNANIG